MAIVQRIDKDGKRRWQVRIAVRDANGKRQNRTIDTFATKKEAQRAEREALSARDRGAVIGPDRLTVAELVDGWLALKAPAVSKNSARDYEGVARLHIKPAVGSIRVQRLSGETLQAAYTGWREAGLSPAMIRKCHVVVSQSLDLAV
ncbi:MAG: Arm DNA-binding domain-containing protein, partial [Chloroflexia bacterium]|nr:Arm DNA-binding domain-containing protein [Chloroflexia bacterium]